MHIVTVWKHLHPHGCARTCVTDTAFGFTRWMWWRAARINRSQTTACPFGCAQSPILYMNTGLSMTRSPLMPWVYACLHVCVYLCMYALHILMYVYIYVCMHACTYVCMHVCMCINFVCCTHTHTHMYIYMYIHTYIYIYIYIRMYI